MNIVPRPPEFEQAFKSMNQKAQRIAIAKDVIAQMNSKKYHPRGGIYIDLYLEKNNCEFEGVKPLHEVVKATQMCDVCAIGAMCLSAATVFDGVEWNGQQSRYWGSDGCEQDSNIRKVLHQFFDEQQLALIEAAFEGDSRHPEWINDFVSDDDLETCYRFADEHWGHQERLQLIMQNIINNDGEFRPELLPIPESVDEE